MDNEKRMLDDYEVLASLWHGGKEYILGEDKSGNTDKPYMTCIGIYKQFFASYENVLVSDDYLEIFNIFTERLAEQSKQLLAERVDREIEIIPLTVADCIKDGLKETIEGKIIILHASSLSPEYRTADNQIMIALNGNGCRPNARGTAVYCENLYSGEKSRFERYEIAGVADINRLPEWARQKIADIENETQQKKQGKDSILGQIKDGKKTAALTPAEKKKRDLEL